MTDKKFPLFLKITGILCIIGGMLMVPIMLLLRFAPQSFGRSLELLQINLFSFIDLLGINILIGIGFLWILAIIGFVAIFLQKKFGYAVLRIMGLLSAAILFFFVSIKSYFSDNLYMIIIGAITCVGMLMTVGMLLYEYKKPSKFFRRTLIIWLLTIGTIVVTIALFAEPSQQHLLAYGQPIDYTKVVNYRVLSIEPFSVLTGERSYLTGSLPKIGLLFPLLLLLIWYADRKYMYLPSKNNSKKWYLTGGILVSLLVVFSRYYRGYFIFELKLPEIVPGKFHKIGYQEVASDKNFYIKARQRFGANESFFTKEFENSLFVTKGMSGGKIIYADTKELFESFNNQYSGTINTLITDVKELNQLTGMVPYTDTEIRRYGGLRGAVITLNARAYRDCAQGKFNQCRDTRESIYTFMRKFLEAGDSSINTWCFLSMNNELISGLQEILALPSIPKGLFTTSLVQQPYQISNIQHNILVQEYLMTKEWGIDSLEREKIKNNLYIPTSIFDAKQTENILKAYFSLATFDNPELFFQSIGYKTSWGLPRYNAGGFLMLSNILPSVSRLQEKLEQLEQQRIAVVNQMRN